MKMPVKKWKSGAGEMAQQLGALVLVEDTGLVPTINMMAYHHP